MAKRTRRQFLKQTAAAGGALAASSLASDPAQAAEAQPDMTIARWSGAPLPEEEVGKLAAKLVTEAIDGLGGMGRFVKNGNTVWIKPNMAWDRTPEQAANTNPDLVAALVTMCLGAGAKSVKVGDRTCNEAKLAYPKSGIEAAAKAAGAEVVYLDDKRTRKMDIGGDVLKTWDVFPEIVESDLVINVPVLKNHSIAHATICMKNYMGVVNGSNRGVWHQNLSTCLCDITRFMKPTLCVVDATRILTKNGPTGGNLEDVKRLDTVAAGTDIVALDALGVELMGYELSSVPVVDAAHAAGLGEKDYRKKNLKEIEVTAV
jgi:uncharacterized protein (DUF362 family)